MFPYLIDNFSVLIGLTVDICNFGRTQAEKSPSASSFQGTSNGIHQTTGGDDQTSRRLAAESSAKSPISRRRVFNASI